MRRRPVDWTPLADIKPLRRGRGFSMFTPEEGERIRRFVLENDIPVFWVSEFFGGGLRQTLYNIMHRTTKYRRQPKRALSEDAIRAAYQRHVAGESVSKVSRAMRINKDTLRDLFIARGWKITPYTGKYRRHIHAVERMTRKGMTIGAISRELGISRSIVGHCRSAIRREIQRDEQCPTR